MQHPPSSFLGRVENHNVAGQWHLIGTNTCRAASSGLNQQELPGAT